MAIIVEQEKKPVNWVGIIGGAVVIVIIFIGTYYLFFKQPSLIEVVVPSSLEPLNQISKVQPLDPTAVINSPSFKALKDYTVTLPPAVIGRSNPFKPF